MASSPLNAVVVFGTAALAAAVCMWRAHSEGTEDTKQLKRKGQACAATRNGKKSKHGASAAKAYQRHMTEEQYTALIPAKELQEVQALLSLVYKHRGWAYSRAQCQAAWQEVIHAAMREEGGAWTPQFSMQELQPAKLQLLANKIDEKLLGGQLQAWLQQQQQQQDQQQQQQQPMKGPVLFQPISWSAGPDNWYANYFPHKNTVALMRSKWAETALVVSPTRPADCEGVHCTTRLQVLAHTLAHEMVHALVYHRLPHMDASSPAYLVDDRHGPIFRLLSLKLLGHTHEDFRLAGRAALRA